MKKLIVVVFLIGAAYVALTQRPATAPQFGPRSANAPAVATADNGSLERAYEQHEVDVRVHGSGTVERVLSDDNDGARHQRFIVRLSSSHTILIAHNIDIAQRVSPLAAGDAIEFTGEYVWNNKGGVVHWTHRDPAGHHDSGWIRHNGKTFQ